MFSLPGQRIMVCFNVHEITLKYSRECSGGDQTACVNTVINNNWWLVTAMSQIGSYIFMDEPNQEEFIMDEARSNESMTNFHIGRVHEYFHDEVQECNKRF